jgi:hypothetical protein
LLEKRSNCPFLHIQEDCEDANIKRSAEFLVIAGKRAIATSD